MHVYTPSRQYSHQFHTISSMPLKQVVIHNKNPAFRIHNNRVQNCPFFPNWTILGSRLHYFNPSLKIAHKFQHTTQTRNDTQKIQHFGSTTPSTKLSLFQPWTILGSRLHYFNSSSKIAPKFSILPKQEMIHKKKIHHFRPTIPGTKLSLFRPWTILGSRLHYFSSSLKIALHPTESHPTRNSVFD